MKYRMEKIILVFNAKNKKFSIPVTVFLALSLHIITKIVVENVYNVQIMLFAQDSIW